MTEQPEGYCHGCQTIVGLVWVTTLRKNSVRPTGWYTAPHNWEHRSHTKVAQCGRTVPYSPNTAAVLRRKWTAELQRLDRLATEFAIDSNNRPETKAYS